MRRLLRVLLVLVLLVGAAWVADTVLRSRAETRIAGELDAAVPGVERPPDVTIEGFPFLTQVAAGELQSVRLAAPAATVADVRLEDVVVRLREVSTAAPYTAGRAEMTALLTPAAATAALGLDGVELAVRGAELVLTTDLLGLPLDAVLAVRPEGRDVVVDVTGFVLAGVGVDAAELPGGIADALAGLRFEVTGLPAGTSLTAVRVVPAGIEVAAAGEDLDLSAAG